MLARVADSALAVEIVMVMTIAVSARWALRPWRGRRVPPEDRAEPVGSTSEKGWAPTSHCASTKIDHASEKEEMGRAP